MRKRKKVEKKSNKKYFENVPKNYTTTLYARERRETLSGKPSRRVKKKKTENRFKNVMKQKCVFECALQHWYRKDKT